MPIRLSSSPGQARDKTAAPALIECLTRTTHVVADRGYDAMALVERINVRGAEAHIPTQRDRKYSAPWIVRSTGNATSWRDTSTSSNTSDASPPGSKSSPPSHSPLQDFGPELMSLLPGPEGPRDRRNQLDRHQHLHRLRTRSVQTAGRAAGPNGIDPAMTQLYGTQQNGGLVVADAGNARHLAKGAVDLHHATIEINRNVIVGTS